MAASTISLKLLVDSTSQKVLFAEAGKDFVDSLFNILSLPVGHVTGLLTKQDMAGCLGNLYESLENLSDTYMQPMANKDTLLKPTVSGYAANVPHFLPKIQSSTSTNLYRCTNAYSYRDCGIYVANNSNSICPSCKQVINQLATVVNAPEKDEGGYVKGAITYMIMDDLAVRPMSTMSTISSITLLNKFKIKDAGVLEEKVIDVGPDEGLKLLKASLQSKTVLTDVFLGKKAGQSDASASSDKAAGIFPEKLLPEKSITSSKLPKSRTRSVDLNGVMRNLGNKLKNCCIFCNRK
ncbi:hypothetical protein DITRI_Ditri09bG0120000 [Diplodiscus trichospermus]